MAGPTVSAPRVEAIIFDMDGTMVDSMPWHARAWGEFARRRGLALDVDDLMRRTTGRNAYECACELMERVVSAEESAAITHEKESIYRELFGAAFAEVPGFRAFAAGAAARGVRIAIGTAGDRHNIAFVMSRLDMDPPPLAIVGGDEGLPGKPRPDIFLRHRGGTARRHACRRRLHHPHPRRARGAARRRGRAHLRRARPFGFSGDIRCCNCVMDRPPSIRWRSCARTTSRPHGGSTPSSSPSTSTPPRRACSTACVCAAIPMRPCARCAWMATS